MTDPKTKSYMVTKHAGPRIDGKLVKAGTRVKMTPVQAQALLISGALEDPDAAKKPPVKPDPKTK